MDHTKALRVLRQTPQPVFYRAPRRGEENERLHVWVLSSAIDRDVERGIGLTVAHSQGSRPVMDQRCLNTDCGGQSSWSRKGVTKGGKQEIK